MTWSRTPPLEPGYYWMREQDVSGTAQVVVIGARGSVLCMGVDRAMSLPLGVEFWLIRLNPPGE
jgi:hypothetical protein